MKNEIHQQNTDALQKAVADKRESLRLIRFGGAGSRSRNVRESRTIRKDIARMLTEISMRNKETVAQSGKKA